MSNPVFLALVEVDRDDIEPTFSILKVISHQESPGDFSDLLLLGRSDRFFGKTEVCLLSGFDLNKDQCVLAQGDNVYLSSEQAKVLSENFVFFIF